MYDGAFIWNSLPENIGESKTLFGPNVVTISARNMQKYTKFANFARLYFPHFTTFRNQTFQFYSI
jgi:hypothetical protein